MENKASLTTKSSYSFFAKSFVSKAGKFFSILGTRYVKADEVGYSLCAVTGTTIKIIPLTLEGDNKPTSFEINEIDNENIVVAGLYDDGFQFVTDRNAKGVFTVVFNYVSGTVVSKKLIPFNRATLAQLKFEDTRNTKGIEALKNGEIKGLRTISLLKSSDNNFVLVTDWKQNFIAHFISSSKILIGFDKDLNKTFETVIDNHYETSEMVSWMKAYTIHDKLLLLCKIGTEKESNLRALIVGFDGKTISDAKYEAGDTKYRLGPWITYLNRNRDQVVIAITKDVNDEEGQKFGVLTINAASK